MALLFAASLVVVTSAKSFLENKVGASAIERALLSELSGMVDRAQLSRIDEELGHMFAALPKNQFDRLDPVSVRYALHRYFMQKHGWYVNGLGNSNGTDVVLASTSIMKARAPAFIQNIFEQRLRGQGLDRRDLAVFVATLTDLIHSEVSGNLQDVYDALDFPTIGPVTEREFDTATKAYLAAYLTGGEEVVSGIDELLEHPWDEEYPAWNDTLMWASDLKLTLDSANSRNENPFSQRRWRSFEQQVSFLQEFGHRLGTFQNLECHRLKDQLAEMEDVGTGRVPLSRFYRGGLDGDWAFSESVEYLRHIGALDESNPKRMSVVIPNYIQSQSNCLAASSFYSICCFDECEDLLGHVEREVKGPRVTPSQIAAVTSRLQSDTVHAPRNLSKTLLHRLDDIASHHGGEVPLHGRLFAQWMHHAYPRECPFPHVIGATNRVSHTEWMDAMDVDSAEATEDEMSAFVRAGEEELMTHEAKLEALPWTMAEELVAGHLIRMGLPQSSMASRALRIVLAATILVAALARHVRFTMPGEANGKATRCEV